MDVDDRMFPFEVKKIYNNSTVYLKRESIRWDAEPTRIPTLKPLIKHENFNLNQEYIEFKKSNGYDAICHGKILIFDNEKCYSDQIPLTIHNCNFFVGGLRYVIDEYGKVFLPEGGETHDKILAGQYIICAGMLRFNENSKIAYLDNCTGHYQTSAYHLHQAVLMLGNQDMLAPDVVIKVLWGEDLRDITVYDYPQFLNLEFKAPDTIMQLVVEEQAPNFMTSRCNFIVTPKYTKARKFLYLLDRENEERLLTQMQDRKFLGPRPRRQGGVYLASVVTDEMIELQLQRVKTIQEKTKPYTDAYEEFAQLMKFKLNTP